MVDWLSKIPPWVAAVALLGIAGAFVYVAAEQPSRRFTFAGLDFGPVKEADLSFRDAIVAFDRKEGCPTGWVDVGLDPMFRDRFAGRVLLVAGPSQDRDRGGSTVERKFNEEGGEEKHTLIEEEIPRHSHPYSIHKGIAVPERIANSSPGSAYVRNPATAETHNPREYGNGGAHNNMQPFIALYFCRRGGG